MSEKKTNGTAQGALHYLSMDIEPIEVMQADMTPEEFEGFCKGNAIKYLLRAGKKNGEEKAKEYEKAAQYATWLVTLANGGKIEIKKGEKVSELKKNGPYYEVIEKETKNTE